MAAAAALPFPTYKINEIYRTIHGEGVRYGIPHVFVRFSLCNLTCNFCDTEFESGRHLNSAAILEQCERLAANPEPETGPPVAGARQAVVRGPAGGGPIRNVLFCGGEPLMQLDAALVDAFKRAGWFTCVETNGCYPVPDGVDWVTCSPKVAEHAIKLQRANELKYVRGNGQGIPQPKLKADHYLISPLFSATNTDKETLQWCIQLVMDNPQWRLTVQHHKIAFGNLR
jgi:organic radical activating enzyme